MPTGQTRGAASHIRAGRFSEARAALAGRTDPSSLVERARLALQANDHTETARLVETILASKADDSQRLTARALRSAAMASIGKQDPTPIRAADFGSSKGDELALYYTASAAYYRGEYGAADEWLSRRTPKEPAMRARFLILRGNTAAARGKMATQLELAETALEILQDEAPDEIYLIAVAAHIVAVLLRELPQKGAGKRLEELEASIAWNDDLEVMHFQLLRVLGWMSALRGKYVAAVALLARAAFTVRSPVLGMYAHLDRACVGIFAGESGSAQADFLLAEQLSQRIDWGTIRTESVAVLPLAAQVAAELEQAASARKFLQLATSTRGQMDPSWSLAHGPRLEAFIAEASALTLAEGQPKKAIAAATAAFETFDAIGYGWRAGRMALLLFELAGDVRWRAHAERWFAHYPGSPFARLLKKTAVAPLTERQREVLDLTLKGMSAPEIADELGISHFTVYNHQVLIKKRFGVRTTPELVAKVAR